MNQDLISICIVAFVSVMVILTLLAGVIFLLTRIFPPRAADRGTDPAIIAAIHTAVASLVPGAVVTSIKEEK